MKIVNIHDRFVKEIFSKNTNAIDFFQNYLSDNQIKKLNLSKIKKCPDSFIDEKFKEHRTDILFEVPFIGQKQKFQFYTLFEHKSYLDKKIHKQMLNYLCQIQLSKEEAIPTLPIVFYTGKKKWEYSTRYKDHYNIPKKELDSFSDYLLDYRYILINLNDLNLKKIETNETLYLELSLMQYAGSDNFGEKLMVLLKTHKKFVVSKVNTKFLHQFFLYAIEAGDINEKKFNDFLTKELSNEIGEVFMTTGQRLRKQGLQEGELKGKLKAVKGMLEDGLPLQNILKYTDLTENDLISAGLLKG